MKGWGKINKEINYGRVGAWVSVGSIAVGLSVIVGCSAAVTGSAVPNEAHVAAYQSEVSISMAAASSSKAAADAAEAAFAICEEAVSRSKNDVVAFNAYVDAGNHGETDLKPKQALLLRRPGTPPRGSTRSRVNFRRNFPDCSTNWPRTYVHLQS